MTTYRREYDAPFSRYAASKRDVGGSMLEYSERMRHINVARGNSFGRHNRDFHPDTDMTGQLEITARKQNLCRSQGFPQRRRLAHDHYHHHHHHHNNRLLHERPLSFNEKELRQSNCGDYQRPRRDTKSERPIVIPSGLSDDLPDTPTDKQKQVKVSFVSASDLDDLVDFSIRNKHAKGHTDRMANLGEGIQLIEELNLIPRGPSGDNSPAYVKRPSVGRNSLSKDSVAEHPPKVLNVDNVSSLLSGKKIKNDISRTAVHKTDASVSGQSLIGKVNTTDADADSHISFDEFPEQTEENPLDILLEQAAAQHLQTTTKQLPRPKRAKRMHLHQPELFAIPEDGGTFVHSGKSVTARQEMLTSSMPVPSSRSLQAIRDSSTRPRGDGSVDNNSMDSLVSISVYPDLASQMGADRESKFNNRQTVVAKGSSKEKAQRKMKRLIFLRDQPDQYYRHQI